MSKKNCWEIKNCGRERNGSKTDEQGICPSSTEKTLDGVHGGKNSGRACWIVAGTMCCGKIKGTYAQKYNNCRECDFYKTVKEEEGLDMEISIVLLKRLKGNNVEFAEYK